MKANISAHTLAWKKISPLLLFVLVMPLLRCATSGPYRCPSPIGTISREDCDAYKIRYDHLRAEVNASLGPLRASAALGSQALRDPSELIQILAQRTFALCRDYNACRLPTATYTQKKEALTRVFTAIAAISAQLRSDLSDESKRALVARLNRLLTSKSPRVARASSSPRRVPKRFYRDNLPWYGAKLLPPQPAPHPGFPLVVGIVANVHPGEREVRTGPHSATIYTEGYTPSIHFALLGKVQADDLVTLRWNHAVVTEKPVSRLKRNGLVIHGQAAPKSLRLEAKTFHVAITYRRGSDGKEATLAEKTFSVISSKEPYRGKEIPHYRVNLDPLTREGRFIFHPKGPYLPHDFDQPHIAIVVKVYKRPSTPTARCWVDGKPITGAMTPGRHSRGLLGELPFVPGPSGQGPRRASLKWIGYAFPLPFLISRRGRALPQGFHPWPRPGRWRCLLRLDGAPARELRFSIDATGRPTSTTTSPKRPRPDWPVETKLIPNAAETALFPSLMLR